MINKKEELENAQRCIDEIHAKVRLLIKNLKIKDHAKQVMLEAADDIGVSALQYFDQQ